MLKLRLLLRHHDPLSRRLLLWILLLSGFFTLLGTGIQLFSEYRSERQKLDYYLVEMSDSVLPSVGLSLWYLDDQLLKLQLDGLMTQRDTRHIEVWTQKNELFLSIGEQPDSDSQLQFFTRSWPLTFRKNQQDIPVGKIVITMTLEEIHRELQQKVFLILATQGVKTFVMSICILSLIYLLVIRFLNALSRWANEVGSGDNDSPEMPPLLSLYPDNDDAISRLRHALKNMLVRQNQHLADIKALNENLDARVKERTYELQESIEKLSLTQAQMVEQEKMAALGQLVAGVAHELNTPLGVAVTANSSLSDKLVQLQQDFSAKKLRQSQLQQYISDLETASSLIDSSLQKSDKLVVDFKKIAVLDKSQTNTWIGLSEYFQIMFNSRKSQLQELGVNYVVSGDARLQAYICVGDLASLLAQLINNSLKHGFDNIAAPEIYLGFRQEQESLILDYRDNGVGLDKQQKLHLFEPFYTTARDQGATGLGMHIVYNVVVQKFLGAIEVLDSKDGIHLHIQLNQCQFRQEILQ